MGCCALVGSSCYLPLLLYALLLPSRQLIIKLAMHVRERGERERERERERRERVSWAALGTEIEIEIAIGP